MNLTRRHALAACGLATSGLLAPSLIGCASRRTKTPVFIARNQRYAGDLVRTLRDGLAAAGLNLSALRGKRVLLKPNLVEPTRDIPHMTTHPAVIVAAAEVFRSVGASVKVGEAPGHVRDTQTALIISGVGDALRDAELNFADLNYEAVGYRRNRGKFSQLPGLYFPQSILEADLVVSLPKMKTHHWVGVTCAMKNLYGTLPGIKYGWPKNVLHHNGIPQTVADINSTLPRVIGIVDGIDCMEGDGPILGSLKPMGLIAIGTNLPALDATVARIMGIVPERIEYLALASRRLGAIDDSAINQLGENWQEVASPFTILDRPHLRNLRASEAGPLVS